MAKERVRSTKSSQMVSREGAIALLLAIMLAVAEMSWWLRSILDVAAIALMIHLFWGLSLRARLRILMIGVASLVLVAVTWRPILEDYGKKHLHASGLPKDGSLADSKSVRTPLSTMGRTIYRCHSPKRETTRRPTDEQIEKWAQTTGDAFGFEITYNNIPAGIKLEFKPRIPEAALKMGGATAWTLELRRSGDDLLVTSIITLPEPLSIIGLLQAEPNSQEIRRIEQMLGLTEGKCEMM